MADSMTPTPAVEISDLQKKYQMGDSVLQVLKGVSLRIDAGEFVAIMGPSGSGKSTLMHVLGLLDRADSGTYKLQGVEATTLGADQLAILRRDTIGFVFQQFNLLPRLTALENVALPLIYSPSGVSYDWPKELLERVGLGGRLHHRPNQLSGGQQQRVAIARALMNRPRIILADEPTGNLDSKSSNEILTLLKELNALGITVVIVTHEEDVARNARRVVRMRDGSIYSDERISDTAPQAPSVAPAAPPTARKRLPGMGFMQHIFQGFRALSGNKVRTALSMLGILIGVAAVIAMLAIGRGAQASIETQLTSLGSNLLVLRPGASRVGGVTLEVGSVSRLTLDDASALKAEIPGIVDTGPTINGRVQVTFQDQNWNSTVLGAAPSYASMRNGEPQLGRFFTAEEDKMRSRIAILGTTVVRNLFGAENPIGKFVKLNKISFQVIGILPERGSNGWRDQDDTVIIPVQTAMHRLLGKDYVDQIDIEASSGDIIPAVQKSAVELMIRKHRVPPTQQQDAFEIRNMADIQNTLAATSKTMSMLLATIAAISLLVGGIGIMNIMLVSVSERTREIGLRKAVGAKGKDILTQFLAESIVVSGLGGCGGIAVGYLAVLIISVAIGWAASIALDSILLAVLFSTGIGVVFGLYPALRAARLDPIQALRYE